MKKLGVICLLASMIFFLPAIAGMAQTQTVTLVATNGIPISYNCNTNQVITVNSFIGTVINGSGVVTISFNNGLKTQMNSYLYGINQQTYSSQGGVALAIAGNAIFTGVTSISVATLPSGASGAVAALTFTIATPTVQSSIPANAVVIPTDATGPVQIVLESSSDLVNWTSSLPGTYGSTYTNRFFRVRAIAQ